MAGKIPDSLPVSEIVKATGWNLPDCCSEAFNDVMRKGKTRAPFTLEWTQENNTWKLHHRLDPDYRLPLLTNGAHYAIVLVDSAEETVVYIKNAVGATDSYTMDPAENKEIWILAATESIEGLTYSQAETMKVDGQEIPLA